MTRIAYVFSALMAASPVLADSPNIEDVRVERGSMGWRFFVTISHPDSGWDHYADGWEILDADGNRLGYRELHHPHVDEQPFTRSLSDVVLPDGTQVVFVRTSCSVENWSGALTRVEISY